MQIARTGNEGGEEEGTGVAWPGEWVREVMRGKVGGRIMQDLGKKKGKELSYTITSIPSPPPLHKK